MEEMKKEKEKQEKEIEKEKEEIVEFDLEKDGDKSKIIAEYPAGARFEVERGNRNTSYLLNLVAKIEGNKVSHIRTERLSESRHQFLIKYLLSNLDNDKKSYNATFQVRESNKTGNRFYCWIVTIDEDYKESYLVERAERKFLEQFYFKDKKKDEKAVK